MEFKKITISLPKNLYNESMNMIQSGLFSNFSDLVRSGIREEFKELQEIRKHFDERVLYNDKRLIAGIKQSVKEAKSGKGRVLKSDKDVDKYLKEL